MTISVAQPTCQPKKSSDLYKEVHVHTGHCGENADSGKVVRGERKISIIGSNMTYCHFSNDFQYLE